MDTALYGGHPVVSQLKHNELRDSYRGAASGVSTHALFPIQGTKLEDNQDWFLSGRLVHSFVRIGRLDIQLVCLYGYPQSSLHSKKKTNQLLPAAIDIVRMNNLPFVIAGDLNHHPTSLEAFESLQSMGCRTAEDFYVEHHGDMPCTFKNSTKNDIAVFSPLLFQSIQEVQVDMSHEFAGHNPLLIDLSIVDAIPTRQFWQLPQPWIALEPDPVKISNFFEFNDELCQQHTNPLAYWAGQVENSVHQALTSDTSTPSKGLPSTHRGRCTDIPLQVKPIVPMIKPGWSGQYTPTIPYSRSTQYDYTPLDQTIATLAVFGKLPFEIHRAVGSTKSTIS